MREGQPATSTAWFTSSLSGGSGGACVEVQFRSGAVSIRDSKYRRDPVNDPTVEPIITVSTGDWLTFLDHLPTTITTGALRTTTGWDGTVALTSPGDGTTLRYTPTEWDAFIGGVRLGEFHPQHQAA